MPFVRQEQPLVWFGLIEAVGLGIGLFMTEVARRNVDTNRPLPIARVLMLNAGLTILSLAGFGLTKTLWMALGFYWLIGALRSVAGPLYAAWFNMRIDDPQVRATMFSVVGQVDAIGQIAGGPAVGLIGNRSLRAALVTSALILSPALPLYAVAVRRSPETGEQR